MTANGHRPKINTRTPFYILSVFWLLAVFGVSSALAASEGKEGDSIHDAAANQANSNRTSVELRNHQRSTSPDANDRQDTRDSDETNSTTNISETTVTVNGEQMVVPENGTMRRTITNEGGDGSTQVDISVENHSSGQTGTDSSTSSRGSNKTMDTNSE